MKPVKQTILGKGEGPEAGNCWQAAIASVLELPLDEVPHFVASGEDWWPATQAWLQSRGLQLVYFDIAPGTDISSLWEPRGYTLLSGKSPRGDYLHCVVGEGFTVIHDPHPSEAGLGGPIEEVCVFSILDPSRIT